MNILELAILKKMVGGGGGSGTNNYNDLLNLPQINGETLAGNKTAANLGLQDALTFDSVPTEDSTNPVESGGVYNALAGKQDNLTFDDDPTENSTNPVKSGGVYNALAGKQDNLTFDGVYNASTNKAATESTVTNAIAGLDVSAYSVDADETISSISETDGKISVNKQDIAIASSQVVAMTGYTKPSSAPATPAIQQGDTANEAIGKLEYKADVNQTNILYGLEHGSKNQLNFDGFEQNGSGITWKINDDKTITATGTATSLSYITLTLNNNYAYADAFCDGLHYLSGCPTGGDFSTKYSLYLAKGAYNPVDTGEGVLIPTTSETDVRVVIKIASGFAIPSGGITFKPMICLKSVYDAYPEYQSYGAPNYDLTRLEAEDRASLAEVVDSGAKNRFIYDEWKGCTVSAGTGVFENNGVSLTSSGNDCFTVYTSPEFPTGARITGKTGETIVISWDYEVADNVEGRLYIFPNATTTGMVFGNIRDKKLEYTFTSGISYITFRCGVLGNGNVAKYKNIMCSTKAAFDVSQKFVPYRPNWDFVGSMATRYTGLKIDPCDFNTLTTPGFYLVAQSGSTNLPWSRGETIFLQVFLPDPDSTQHVIQIGRAINYPSEYCVRYRYQGTWTSWYSYTGTALS